MKFNNYSIKSLFYLCFIFVFLAACSSREKNNSVKFNVPKAYLEEVDSIPSFWITTVEEVNDFIKSTVRKGTFHTIGYSAGERPIQAVFYGSPREGTGSTTFSGSQAISDISKFRGRDNDKTVYMCLAGVHGFELEGIMGACNLISVLETGKDLNGDYWPETKSLLDSISRIIIIPLMNPDGRARVPIRMESHKGHEPDAYIVHEYLNTGGIKDGKLIGWPEVKEYIPMDFSDFEFPGGYPNDNGVNIMHDDFLGCVQPETRALFDLVAIEKPDLIMNMHTGVHRDDYFIHILPLNHDAAYSPIWKGLYTAVHTKLTQDGLKKTTDIQKEAIPKTEVTLRYNLNTALNLHCGALCVVVENASHGYSGIYDDGKPVIQTPEKLLKAELTVHQEAMKFLHRTGGVSKWKLDN